MIDFYLQNKSFLYCMPKSVAYCTSSNDSRSKLPPSIDFNALSERRLIAPLRSSRDAIRDKFSSMYKSYEDYSLTNEVREAHGHVERVQEELKLAQQRRTAVSRELSEIQHNLHLIHGDLVTCKREEPRYLELIRREFEVIILNTLFLLIFIFLNQFFFYIFTQSVKSSGEAKIERI